jgi:hypothetical protein
MGIKMSYMDKFEVDINDADTVESKQKVLSDFINSDFFALMEITPEVREKLKEYRDQIKDIREQIDIESDILINMEIEDGKYKLYSCIKDVDNYKSGCDYYASVDEIKKRYTEKLVGGEVFLKDLDTKIQDYIGGLKDLVWIVTDDGIGTLKRKNLVVDFDFSKHFTIFA